MKFLAVLALCSAFCVIKCDVVTPCDLTESSCLKKVVDRVYSKIMEKDPGMGMEVLDPMFLNAIDGQSTVKYKFRNSTVKGYKKCKVDDVKLNPGLSLQVYLLCPKFSVRGKYSINEKMGPLAIEGNGDFRIDIKKGLVKIVLELNKATNEDGKTHVSVKDFKQTAEVLERVQFEFKNLFNGKKKILSTVLHKYINTHWKEVSTEFQGPAIVATLQKIVKNVNIYLKENSVDRLGSLKR